MKIVLQILLILLICSTISICEIKPSMHKNIVVLDSAYKLVPAEEIKTETKQIPILEHPAKPIQAIIKNENNVKQTQITIKKDETKKASVKTDSNPNIKKIETKVIPKTQTIKTVATQNVKQKDIEVIKNEPSKLDKYEETKIIEPTKTLTQQEETIAWNKWRSNLTNQIMQDTKLPNIPNGTIFQFSFNVDKYGKVSNVQTGAVPANYTPYAIQYIGPVIRSYQGHSILNFPDGTARTSTTVSGKWKISNSTKYSSPQDYNDIEKIIK